MNRASPLIPETAAGAPVAQTAVARRPLRRGAKTVRVLSLLDLLVVVLVTGVLWIVSERTWWGTIFTFLPRHEFLVLPGLLLICSLFIDRWSIAVNAAALALVLGPLMGGRVSLSAFSTPGTLQTGISVVSCNVNHFGPDFESVLREITSFSPDVVALQETTGDAHLLPQYFPGWHVIAEDQYWIGSRYPLRRLGLCDSKIFRHATALSVRVDAPQGPFILNDVHQTTPRFGFLKVSWDSVRDGTGPQAVESDTKRRLAEALQLRAYVENNSLADNGQPLPVVVVGDFNTPSVSHLYRAAWGDFTNAFGAAGLGFGYTALCGRHEFRFVDIPWVRIDHILTDDRWTVTACEVGRGNGSDHRPIRAVLSRQE